MLTRPPRNPEYHALAIQIEAATVRRVIAATFEALNPDSIQTFLSTAVLKLDIADILSGRQQPKQSMFLLFGAPGERDIASEATMYEFTGAAAGRMDALIIASDTGGFHLR